MARLPRFPSDYTPTGDDLNHILSIIDAGLNNQDPIISGITGTSLTPSSPNPGGAINPAPGMVGALTTPTGLTVISGIDNFSQTHTAFVVLSWTPNPVNDFVTRYDIYYHKGSDSTLYTLSVGGNITSTRINNLFPGNAYSFAVKATDAADRSSAWCSEVKATISLDSDAPIAPVGLTALSAGKGVYLNWVEVGPEGLSNDLKQYEIGVSLASAFSNVISGQRRITVPSANVAGNPTPWIVTVGPGNSFFYPYPGSNTTLFFRIRSVDWTGNKSDWSSVVSATTGGGGITWADISAGAPSSSMTGGLTITTGGLNVTGGATVTGNSTITGTLLVSGTVQVAGTGVDAPAGMLGHADVTSTTANFNTAALADVSGLSVGPLTIAAGRRLRITLTTRIESSVADDRIRVDVADGSNTSLMTWQDVVGSNAAVAPSRTWTFYTVPGAVTITYKIRAQRTAGTGNCNFFASATNPVQLTVEDVGT